MNLEDAEQTLRHLVKELMVEQGLTDEQRHHRVALVVGSWLGVHSRDVAGISDALDKAVAHVVRCWCRSDESGNSERYCALGYLLGAMKAEIGRTKVSE